ncbi:CU044_2847 family protein [Nocardiopsis coralliicola]
MAELVRFRTAGGAEILVEAAGSSPRMRGAGGGDVVREADVPAELLLARARALVAAAVGGLGGTAAATGADAVSVELGVRISADGDVYLAQSAGEAALAVTVTWRPVPEP